MTISDVDFAYTGGAVDGTTQVPLFGNSITDGKWHHFSADLSGYQGLQVTRVEAGIHNSTPQGTFDLYLANAAILRADGSVLTIYNGQPASVTNVSGNCCAAQGMTSGTENIPAIDSAFATTFYTGDHLGSAQLELAAGGWPLSYNQFAPFGAEINPATSINHYKFTGKERDTESGLDYFGARYYGSSMGRFTSPDPFLNSGRPENPQTWNRYTYVLNNPLRNTDPTGLYTCSGDKKQCSGVADSLKGAQGAVGNLKKGSADYNNLSAAISAYEKASVDNGVHVGFGQLPARAARLSA